MKNFEARKKKMTKKKSNNIVIITVSIAVLLVLGLAFWGGYSYHAAIQSPTIPESDTIYVYDTVLHTIPDKPPKYVIKWETRLVRDSAWIDSIAKAHAIDTFNILADFFDLYVYQRQWQDSLIQVTVTDTITQNRPISNVFEYRILRPQQIIEYPIIKDVYSRYLYVGAGVPLGLDSFNPEAIYAFRRGYLGVGYLTKQRAVSLQAGIRIFSW